MPIQRAIIFLTEIKFCWPQQVKKYYIIIKNTFCYGSQKKLEDNFQRNLLPLMHFYELLSSCNLEKQ